MTWQEPSRVSRWGSHVGFHIRSVWRSLYAGQLAPMTTSGLDRIDHRILAVLQEDASRSAAQIAEAVGPALSKATLAAIEATPRASRAGAILGSPDFMRC